MTNREKCIENLKGVINEVEWVYDKVKNHIPVTHNDFCDSGKLLGEIMYIIKELECNGCGEEEFIQPEPEIGTRFNSIEELELAVVRTEVRNALRKIDCD